MKRLVIVLAVVAALVLPAEALAKRPNGSYRGKITYGFLTGTWTIKFYASGTRYEVRGPFGTATGRTRFRGSTVIFDREKELADVCNNAAGKYSYTLRGSVLKMKVIRDTCEPRRIVHTRPTYRKVT